MPTQRSAACVLFIMAVLLAAAFFDYQFYPFGMPPRGYSANKGENGLWLSSDWYDDKAADYGAMADRLKSAQVRYAYFHVHNIDRNGKLVVSARANASAIVTAIHNLAPRTLAIAWVYAGNRSGRGLVDLSKPAVRAQMVREAVRLTTTGGFDGVQWDYEICPDGDRYFLDLLQQTKAALPTGKILCAATPILLPHVPYCWSDSYYGKVTKNCDQIDVMCYDSAATFPRAYEWLTAYDTAGVLRIAAKSNPRCRVLIGAPTYPEWTLSHNPHAESLELALRGIRAGVSDAGPSRKSFAGIAIFADYTTSSSDWKTYRKWWTDR